MAVDNMYDAIEGLAKKLEGQVAGEHCEHSVNICYCGVNELLDRVGELLGPEPDEDVAEDRADYLTELLEHFYRSDPDPLVQDCFRLVDNYIQSPAPLAR